jgi:hypothetical protein
MLVGNDLDFAEGQFYALQSTRVIEPPEWATPVGQAYRLTATDNAPPLQSNASLSLAYLSSDVVAGEEE